MAALGPTKLFFVSLALMFVSVPALAQPAPPQIPLAPVATAADEGCERIEQTASWARGIYTSYLNCTRPLTDNDYGRVHVRWTPPTEVDPAVQYMNQNKRRRWFNGLRRFLGIENNLTGGIVLQVYERRSDTPVGERGTLIYTRALAAYEVSESQGLRITSVTSDLNGPVGPYLMADQVDGIEWVLTAKSSTRPVLQVVAQLRSANELVQGLTGDALFNVSDAALAGVQSAERRIAEVLTSDITGEHAGLLGFAPNSTQNHAIRVSLRPNQVTGSNQGGPVVSGPDTGFLRVTVRRTGTLFNGAHRFEDPVRGVFYDWGLSEGDTVIKTRVIDGRSLASIVASLGPDMDVGLNSDDPVKYQVQCNGLKDWLESAQAPRLNPYDIAAVRWAFAYRGANIGSRKIREQVCAKDFIGDAARQASLAERGLIIRPMDVVVPTRYANAQSAADTRRQTAAESTRAGEDAYAGGVDLSGFDLSDQNIAFRGRSIEDTQGLLGTFSILTGDRAADEFVGYGVQGNPTISPAVMTGYGRYVFAENARTTRWTALAGARPIRFQGHAINGVPSVGSIDFSDGSRFEGAFAAGMPFEGVFTRPQGVVQSGRFIDFKLNGDGVESSATGVRWGSWSSGMLLVRNPTN